MKEFPKSLKIFGYEYSVTVDADRNKEHGASARGSANAYYQKIWIDGAQPFEGMKSTLLHEIIEAINDHFTLDLKHPVICTLETALYQVLKDNDLHFGTSDETGNEQEERLRP